MAEEKKGPTTEVTKSPDFKLVYATGLFGNLNEANGTLVFFVERPTTIMKGTQMVVGSIQRELQIEVQMPNLLFTKLNDLVTEQLALLEDIKKKED